MSIVLTAPLWLASRSPRRERLLREAGVAVRVRPADIDDATIARGAVQPAQWVMALAYLKARRVADALRREGGGARGSVLAADTVCVQADWAGSIMGKPANREEAGEMLRSLRDAEHETITGVCVINLADSERAMFVDRAQVRFGHIDDVELERYLDSGEWSGKAGAYNLQERLHAGWPIECEGDPATVMGLPIRRLQSALGILAAVSSAS